MSPFAYVFIGLLGGALIVGAVVFCVVLFRALLRLDNSARELAGMLRPLLASQSLTKAATGLGHLADLAPQILQGMNSLSQLIAIFNQVAMSKQPATPPSSAASPGMLGEPRSEDEAPEGVSEFIPFSEEIAALREAEAEAKKAGFPVTESDVPEVPEEMRRTEPAQTS